MAAYLFLADRRREVEMAQDLSVFALGQHGDGKAVTKQIDSWMDE